MAKEFLNFHLHISPSTSVYKTFPAKIQASIKPQNHEPRIIHHRSRSRTTYFNRTEARSIENSVSSIKRLTSCINSGDLETALQMFDKMCKSNAFVWNVIIRELVDSGLFEDAILFYYRMKREGIKADNFTFPFVIKACAGVFGLKEGQSVHSAIIKLGLDVDIYICNALIVMYAKVGRVDDSEKLFECMPVRDLVTWNSMISGLVSSGDGRRALMCLQKMHKFGVVPDRFSYIGALGACTLEKCLSSGKEVFCGVLRNGLELDSMIQSSVIDMFGKCRELNYAERFFNGVSRKNLVVWNSMIGAYGFNERPFDSFSCVKMMQENDNVKPDKITLINLLPSCSILEAPLQGRAIHGYAIRNGYLPHLMLETSLIDMYGKCGSVKFAECVFLRTKDRNLVSWNAMISAYVQNSNEIEAIKLFEDLLCHFRPDEMTFSSLLAAYAEIALPKEGRQIHALIYKLGLLSGTFVSNATIHMYAKCGDLESARGIFNKIPFKDLVSWNTIIMAYAIHGYGEYCSRMFQNMTSEGIFQPNGSTFVSLLSGCSISGLSELGQKYFDSMKRDHGLVPGIEHYGCMLDLLGRNGNFANFAPRAKQFIEEMPLAPTHRIWGSLLSASRHHKNVELAELAASNIFELNNDNNTGCYVLLANIYAEVGRWEDAERIKRLMNKRGLERIVSCSIVECNDKSYKFGNYDKSKSGSYFIYDVLDILSRKIGEDLYVSSVGKFKPGNVAKARTNNPRFHSVRLAVSFGLIGTKCGEAVIIRKNVRLCEDCHNAVKKISGVTRREIVVGDSKIYHHFKDGVCSCGDYW